MNNFSPSINQSYFASEGREKGELETRVNPHCRSVAKRGIAAQRLRWFGKKHGRPVPGAARQSKPVTQNGLNITRCRLRPRPGSGLLPARPWRTGGRPRREIKGIEGPALQLAEAVPSRSRPTPRLPWHQRSPRQNVADSMEFLRDVLNVPCTDTHEYTQRHGQRLVRSFARSLFVQSRHFAACDTLVPFRMILPFHPAVDNYRYRKLQSLLRRLPHKRLPAPPTAHAMVIPIYAIFMCIHAGSVSHRALCRFLAGENDTLRDSDVSGPQESLRLNGVLAKDDEDED